MASKQGQQTLTSKGFNMVQHVIVTARTATWVSYNIVNAQGNLGTPGGMPPHIFNANVKNGAIVVKKDVAVVARHTPIN